MKFLANERCSSDDVGNIGNRNIGVARLYLVNKRRFPVTMILLQLINDYWN